MLAPVDPPAFGIDPSRFVPVQGLPPTLDRLNRLLGDLDLVGDVLAFVLVTLTVYLVARLLVVPTLVRVVRARNRNNPTIVTAVETYLAVLAFVVAGLAGLAATGHLSALVGTDSAIVIAALTVVLGVAGQEVFGSLVSGIFLVADRDFNVGDWITWSGGEGYVEAVDFRVTRIRTPNNETVTVPNTELTTNMLTRPFGRRRFRVVERVFVSYDEDTERALHELQQVAAGVEGALADPPPEARVEDLGADNVVVQATFWVADPDRLTVDQLRSDFRRRVKRRFGEADLTLAPPAGQELSGSVTVEEATGRRSADD